MKMLYELTIYSFPKKDYKNPFDIGVFLTEEKARSVAEQYLREVTGFKDYECSYEIVARNVIGIVTDGIVWQAEGWNEDADGDEIDIIQSDFYGSEAAANERLSELQREHTRTEWVIAQATIDKCRWEEGFTRCYY